MQYLAPKRLHSSLGDSVNSQEFQGKIKGVGQVPPVATDLLPFTAKPISREVGIGSLYLLPSFWEGHTNLLTVNSEWALFSLCLTCPLRSI